MYIVWIEFVRASASTHYANACSIFFLIIVGYGRKNIFVFIALFFNVAVILLHCIFNSITNI